MSEDELKMVRMEGCVMCVNYETPGSPGAPGCLFCLQMRLLVQRCFCFAASNALNASRSVHAAPG